MKTGIWLVSLAIVLVSCRSDKLQVPTPSSGGDSSVFEVVAANSKGIQTEVARSSAIPNYLDLPAHIEPDPTRVVRVFAPAGGRIVEMKVRPWDYVEKGQTLATLESSDLARAVSDYHKAFANNQVKQKGLTRAQDLLDHHAISQREFEQAQSDAQQASAETLAAREQVQVFGMDPDQASTQLVIKVPRSGTVLDIGATAGEFSQALSAPAPLATVADIRTVWALGDVYEQDLAAATLGSEAQLTLNAYPGQHWSGHVSVVSGAVDPNTRTLRLRVVLANPNSHIKPGMFGMMRILKSSAVGIIVPAAAVIREGSNSYMFVAKGSGRFERREVKIGRIIDGSMEILSGITAGETIVSDGALFLRSAGQS
jgi:cobalt-zinc-cadmium efflux system membrane fusion protein